MARTRDPELEAQRRAQVTEATIALLAEGSWRSVTLKAVARRAGVSKGLVTYWYDSKDALLVDAIRRFHEDYATNLLGLAARPLPARERLAAVIEAAFPSVDAVRREVQFQTEVWSYAKHHPQVAADLTEAYGHFRAVCDTLLHLGAAEGYVTTAEVDGLTRFVQALVDGLSLHVAWDPQIDLPRERERLVALLECWFQA